MSRHTIEAREPERFECIVGFDAPLDTFFGQVIDRERRARLERQWEERESAYRGAVASGTDLEASEGDSDEDYFTLWVGTNASEVPTVEALADLLDAYAVLTPEMRGMLRGDREREAHPPTHYQQMVRDLLCTAKKRS